MKALRQIFFLASLCVSATTFAASSADIVVTHFEQLQNFQLQQSTAGGLQNQSAGAVSGLRFEALGRVFDLQLQTNDRLLSVDSRNALRPGIQFLKGTIRGSADSWARIVLADGVPRGLMSDGVDIYAIDVMDGQKSPVIYRLADRYVAAGTMSCGATLPAGNANTAFNKLAGELSSNVAFAPGATIQLDLGVISDASFGQRFGASTDVEIAARIAHVDAIFSAQLGVQLQVQVLELFDSVSDPFGPTTVPNELLVELDAYRQSSASQSAQGLTHLYTARDLDGTTVGIAYNPGICLPFGAGLTQGTFDAFTDGLITAHEIGHNFGASHDGVPGPCESEVGDFVMSVSVNGSTDFSACTIAQMQVVMSTANCFVPLPGTDITVTPATPPQLALLGNSATTNFSVRNNGTDNAENVSVDLTIPALADIVSVSATAGSCTDGAGTANCQLNTISGGMSETVVVSTLTSSVGVDSFTATVSATTDDNPANNQAAIQLTVDPAVELILAAPSLVNLTIDTSTSVAVTLSNTATLPANNVVLTASIDAGVTIDTATLSGGTCTINGSDIDCQISTLASQASSTLSLGVTGDALGRQNYSVNVSADEQDRNTVNNSATGSVNVVDEQSQEDDGGGAAGLLMLAFLLATAARRSRRTTH